MRIVQLVENLNVGGMERLAIDMAAAQRAKGQDATIWCIFEPGALAPEAARLGIPVHAFHKPSGFSILTLLRLAMRLRRERIDVLHAHNPGIHLYAAMAAGLARTPVVLNTRHGVANSRGLPYQEDHFRYMMPLTDWVVCVSEHARKHLVDLGIVPAAKARVILNGTPLDRFRGHQALPGSVRPKLRFGTVGRVVPVKQHSQLLGAFAVVLRSFPQAELQIVGDGPLMPELQQEVIRLGLTEAVNLMGARSDIPQVMNTWDIFVLSSSREGSPVVILEAMAAGLPIVSTRVGGVPEVAPEGDVAWYCHSESVPALAEAMITAAASPDLATMGAKGRALAFERFDITRTIETYRTEVYRPYRS